MRAEKQNLTKEYLTRLNASPLTMLDTWSENLWFAVLARKD